MIACVLLGLATQTQPQKESPADSPAQPNEVDSAALPSAEEVFRRNAAAIGEPDKVAAVKSIRIDGRYLGRPFTFPARLTIWREYPNKFHLKIQQPAGEVIEIGFDGQRGWERQPGIGLRKVEGIRLFELRDTSDFWGEANWENRYVDFKVLGRTEFEGVKAVAVHVKALSGREKVLIFSEQSGLYLGSLTKTVHPDSGAPVEFQTVLKPYEEFEGVKIPMGMTQRFKGEEKATEYDYVRVTINPEQKHDFSPPAEILDQYEDGEHDKAGG
ncbi:MAG: hypothetical protein Kow0022_17090 [Phycisphaerales bacterium]